MLICILPPIQFTILHHLMYGTLCACWPWCIWLLSIWLSILLLRMNHCVWAVTCTGIYTRMAGGGSTYACDVSVQFLYETVFTHMTGELWIFAGWWCALSYFVYVFLYDINLLLYIFLPAFPSYKWKNGYETSKDRGLCAAGISEGTIQGFRATGSYEKVQVEKEGRSCTVLSSIGAVSSRIRVEPEQTDYLQIP